MHLGERGCSNETFVFLQVVMGVSFERQWGRVIEKAREEDDDGSERHDWSYQEEAEAVYCPGYATPAILFLCEV